MQATKWNVMTYNLDQLEFQIRRVEGLQLLFGIRLSEFDASHYDCERKQPGASLLILLSPSKYPEFVPLTDRGSGEGH